MEINTKKPLIKDIISGRSGTANVSPTDMKRKFGHLSKYMNAVHIIAKELRPSLFKNGANLSDEDREILNNCEISTTRKTLMLDGMSHPTWCDIVALAEQCGYDVELKFTKIED